MRTDQSNQVPPAPASPVASARFADLGPSAFCGVRRVDTRCIVLVASRGFAPVPPACAADHSDRAGFGFREIGCLGDTPMANNGSAHPRKRMWGFHTVRVTYRNAGNDIDGLMVACSWASYVIDSGKFHPWWTQTGTAQDRGMGRLPGLGGTPSRPHAGDGPGFIDRAGRDQLSRRVRNARRPLPAGRGG
jgi:hypothetical protein